VQVSSDPPTWQGWIEVCALGLRLEGVCVVCRSIWLMISSCMFGRYSVLVQVFFWSFLIGRVGLLILVLDCGKGSVFYVFLSVWCWNLMLFESWEIDMWCFWLLICPTWEVVVCFLQDISGLCMGLLVLALGYLAYFSLLQRFCLVVGCCVLY